MKHWLSFSITIAVLAHNAYGQFPETCMLLHAGFFTGSGGGLVETPDGGVAMAGAHDLTNSSGSDIAVTKLDASGALAWVRTYSTGPASSDIALAIVNTLDGGLAVSGQEGSGLVFLMKIDASGTPVWTKTYDAPGVWGMRQHHNGLVQLADGGFALQLATQEDNDWLMLRTDVDGEILWSDRLEFAGGLPMDVAALPNGDLVFTGNDQGLGAPTLILRKDGLTGTTEWMHWYTNGPGQIMSAHGLITAADSTIVLAGYINDISYYDVFALALSPTDGTPLWSTRVGTDEFDLAEDIAIAPNGDYLLSGRMIQDTTLGPPMGGFVVRLNANGQRLWSRHVDHPDAALFQPVRCSVASDGGVLLSGYSGTTVDYPLGFMKLDASGNTCPYCPSADVGTQNSLSIAIAPDQGSAFTGPWATSADMTFILADITAIVSAYTCGTTGVDEGIAADEATVAPNPFSDHTVITLDRAALQGTVWIHLRDVLGRLVHTQLVQGNSTTIQCGALAPGRYAFSIQDNTGIVAKGRLQVADR
jgi:outer membrane protein assembly factor BamB